MKKGRRPRRRPRLKLSDKAGPDQCPVPGENALFPAQIAGFLAVSRAVPVYPVFLNYVVPVHFLSVCTEDVSKHWWSYCIMLYTGLREGEIGALRPADIHLDSNYIDVHATIVANIDPETGKRASGFVYQNSTKTSKDRRAYFGEAAKVLLTERLKSCPEDCYLANQSRTPVNLVYLGRAFKKVLTYADIENDCTLHDLRHTCATRLIRQGTDVKSVSLQLGHANIQTTLNIYVHPSEEDRARAMLNLHW